MRVELKSSQAENKQTETSRAFLHLLPQIVQYLFSFFKKRQLFLPLIDSLEDITEDRYIPVSVPGSPRLQTFRERTCPFSFD